MGKQFGLFGLIFLVTIFADGLSRAAYITTKSAPAGSQTEEVHYSQESSIGIMRLVARPDTSSLLFRFDGIQIKHLRIGMQAELSRPLLQRYVHEYHYPRHLFIVFRDTSDLFSRIEDAAIASADWDKDLGRPRQGTVSAFIVREINVHHLARELEDSCAAVGYILKAKSAEQVIINRNYAGQPRAVPASGTIEFIAAKETLK